MLLVVLALGACSQPGKTTETSADSVAAPVETVVAVDTTAAVAADSAVVADSAAVVE